MGKVTVTVDSMLGAVYGWLTVTDVINRTTVACLCTCGTRVVVKAYKLINENNKSCGCRKRRVLGDATRIHGRANSRVTGYKDRTYGIWQGMKARCSDPKHINYRLYGGAGIRVCPEWAGSFEAFLNDMGDAPDGLTLDRIDGSKGYSKANCRWVTYKAQAQNSKRVRLFTFSGKTQCISDWKREWGMGYRATLKRLKSSGSYGEC